MQSRVVVKFLNPDSPHEEFTNAEVGVAAPGLFVVLNAQGEELARFPIGAVRAVVFPDGPSRIMQAGGIIQ